jgi:hypothetical protein
MASLPLVHPEHRLLDSRRAQTAGEVTVALVCFKERVTDERVVVEAVAVRGTSAWSLDAVAAGSCARAVARILASARDLGAGAR